jgi:hypothetical protein
MTTPNTQPQPVDLKCLLLLVDSHMRMHYGRGLEEMEISNVPGYWRDQKPQMHLGHPLHGCIGCSGPFCATYTYFDQPRHNGRFASRTQTWAMIARLNKDTP